VTILFMEGFERVSLSSRLGRRLASTSGLSSDLDIRPGFIGSSLGNSGASQKVLRTPNLTGTLTPHFFGRMIVSGDLDENDVASFKNGSSTGGTLFLSVSDGEVTIGVRDSLGTLVSSVDLPYYGGWLQISWTIQPTVGGLTTVWLDGAEILSETGNFSMTSGTATSSEVYLPPADDGDFALDDWIFSSTLVDYEFAIVEIRYVSNGGLEQMDLVGSGTHAEVLQDDEDFTYLNADAGEEENYGVSSFIARGEIEAIQARLEVRDLITNHPVEVYLGGVLLGEKTTMANGIIGSFTFLVNGTQPPDFPVSSTFRISVG